MTDRPRDPAFVATRWTLVLQARGGTPEARSALAELCEIYYQPIVSFIKHWRRDRDEDAAREQAHAFFESILTREAIGQPDPQRGRFRNYLIGAVKNYLSESHRSQSTARRGGQATHEPLGPELEAPPVDETRFDRAWALALIGRALGNLESEMHRAGRLQRFEVLKPWLDGNARTPQSEAAAVLGLSETAIKVSIHRLREQFRAKVRVEVAATLYDPAELDAELAHLVAALVAGPAGD